MSISRSRRTLLFSLAAVVVCAAGALWLYITEPWYSHELVRRMQPGNRAAPWRDETPRIADLFPDGMSRAAAMKYLATNGFSCAEDKLRGEVNQFKCVRDIAGLPCRLIYSVYLSLRDDETIGNRKADSYAGCL
jgi:hypothetical protein